MVLRVRVVPRARANALGREADGRLRARLTAPPVEGAANRALLALLAKALGVRRGDLALLHGAHGRDKLVAVHGLGAAEVDRRVAALAGADVDKARRRG